MSNTKIISLTDELSRKDVHTQIKFLFGDNIRLSDCQKYILSRFIKEMFV